MDKDIIEAFQQFLTDNKLAGGTLDDGCGNKIKVKRTRHGYFKVSVTSETLNVKEEEDGGE